MNKILTIILALLGATLPITYHLHASETHHHSDSHHQHEMGKDNNHHHHETVTISEGQPVPNVDLVVYEDTMRGWNLKIELDNFAFAPESVNQENQPNKGHAHLYINGEKITRIYSNWYYLPELPTGNNEVKIALNTNSHESLMYRGEMIEDTEIINVP